MSSHVHMVLTGGTIDSIFDGAHDMVVAKDSSTIAKYLVETVSLPRQRQALLPKWNIKKL